MLHRRAALGAGLILALLVLALAAAALGGAPGPTPAPSGIAGLGTGGPSPLPGQAASPSLGPPNPASPGPSSPYTFDDEFDGPGLSSIWGQHFSCCGAIVAVDPSLSSVSGGYLSLAVADRAAGWYGALVDTKYAWTQEYGYFEASIKVPAGDGLWPAFWGYASGGGAPAEIDTMEVCPSATAATSLHTSVHWSDRGSDGHVTQTRDLSQGFHTYAVDWRPDHLTYYLDGAPVWTYTNAANIPHRPLPLILDLGVGGDFCGPADASTPSGATMLVDWVRVRP